ncbi:hypothetical protein K438DRAFT_1754952 [Mycena galopus ATCC 62051]|nr:hypothetical protein K438DRAFT_1754952 [Mycena galopus ATCC 62051]
MPTRSLLLCWAQTPRQLRCQCRVSIKCDSRQSCSIPEHVSVTGASAESVSYNPSQKPEHVGGASASAESVFGIIPDTTVCKVVPAIPPPSTTPRRALASLYLMASSTNSTIPSNFREVPIAMQAMPAKGTSAGSMKEMVAPHLVQRTN